MEHLEIIARSDFVNRQLGNVSRKQRLFVPQGVARELVAMRLADLADAPPKPQPLSSVAAMDGEGLPSASSPAVQVSPESNAPKRKRGRPRKDGASSASKTTGS